MHATLIAVLVWFGASVACIGALLVMSLWDEHLLKHRLAGIAKPPGQGGT